MDEYTFTDHAARAMRTDAITVEGVYHVIGNADDIIEYDNGRTGYYGEWEGRAFLVVIEQGDEIIVTVTEIEKRRRHPRRRKR